MIGCTAEGKGNKEKERIQDRDAEIKLMRLGRGMLNEGNE